MGALGGVVIGAAAGPFLLANGRIIGASGILGSLARGSGKENWHERVAFLAGGLFGAGLLVSCMVDTRKVRGWLDLSGDWDPTLAFVLSGAAIPMIFVWRRTEGRRPALGGFFPPNLPMKLDRSLAIGSMPFGAGWGLAGLCPRPAVASLSFGGLGRLVFFAAMLVGMLMAVPIRARIESMPRPA